MIRGLIVDFDGPVFDGRSAFKKAHAETVKQFEAVLGIPRMTLHGLPLMGAKRLIALMYEEFEPARDQLRTIQDFYKAAVARIERTMTVNPEVHAWLSAMKQHGLRLALLTGRPDRNVNELLQHLGITQMFDVVAGRDSVPAPKPSPEAVRFVAQRLACSSIELMMIGDADVDYQAAVAAEVAYLHAGWSDEPSTVSLRHRSLIVERPDDLTRIMFDAPALPMPTVDIPRDLADAVTDHDLAFFAGAGVAVPSGLGGWDTQYAPLLRELGVGWMERHLELPALLQLACTDTAQESHLFDAFKKSFSREQKPNAYHFAMIRSLVPRIWTSNYDQLFERAIERSGITDLRVVRDDNALLNHFRDSTLVVKVNGDFETAVSKERLEWDVVATQDQFDMADHRRREIWRLFEDDFRNRSIVFVGVSFHDPILRRILAVAASRVPRTRHSHYLLMKLPSSQIERALQGHASRNLARYNIKTLTFGKFTDVEQFVSRLAIKARRPVIGISGNTNTPPGEDHRASDDLVLEGGSFDGARLRLVCHALGEALASAGYRVTSGCAPYVGIDAVNAAFNVNSSLARFYLRRAGGTKYRSTAPTIVVSGDSNADMRARFVGEVSVLIAIAGYSTNRPESGVADEIERAMARKAAVLLVPHAGGDVARLYGSITNQFAARYGDPGLAAAIREANAVIKAVAPGDLVAFMKTGMLDQVDRVLRALVQTATDADAASNRVAAPW